jgi:hypothetical protein
MKYKYPVEYLSTEDYREYCKSIAEYFEADAKRAALFDEVMVMTTGKLWESRKGEHKGEVYRITKTEFAPYVGKYVGGTIYIENVKTKKIHYFSCKDTKAFDNLFKEYKEINSV